jgi:hypothetical protein
MIEDFSNLPPVSMTSVVYFELRISPQIFKKIRNGPNGILIYSGAWGKLIHEKTRSRKSRDTVPLTTISAKWKNPDGLKTKEIRFTIFSTLFSIKKLLRCHGETQRTTYCT